MTEDSILEQMHNANVSSFVAGEDIWQQLFPKRFFKDLKTTSGLVLYDMGSVDTKAFESLKGNINKDQWDLFICKSKL